jgi:DNA/RNA endonuclease G (NUC1)
MYQMPTGKADLLKRERGNDDIYIRLDVDRGHVVELRVIRAAAGNNAVEVGSV